VNTTHHHHSEATDGRRRRWHFIRHYLEMVIAMFAGMFILGGATDLVLYLTDTSAPWLSQPEPGYLKMAFDMSVGMVLWMRIRGHGWGSSLEMSAAMFVPVVPLFPLLWLGAIDENVMMLVAHIAMFPLMLLVMLRRRAEFGG
jgi:hypothetical protein